jgi:hypothetical protein
MQHIETVTLGSAQTVTFTSIPDTFTDLVIYASIRGSSNPFLGMGFNNSVVSFSNRQLTGDGSGAGSSTRSDTFIGSMGGSSDTANTFGSAKIYIPNYAGASNKSFSVDLVSENNATGAFQTITAGLWSNTAAITSVELYQWNSGNAKEPFAANSTISLYGITAGSDGIVAVS